VQDRFFKSPRDGLDFWLFVVVTFLVGLSRSAQSLLAPILDPTLSAEEIGIVLSASAVPMVAAALYASALVRRWGVYPVALTGIALMLVGHLGFDVTRDSFAGAATARAVEGLGFGLFVPASMLFAKYRLGGKSPVYLFGIHSSMMLWPAALGPAAFELYLNRFGPDQYFVHTALPFALAMALSLFVACKRDRIEAGTETAAEMTRRDLLIGRRTGPPYLAILLVGVVSGFINAYMAAFLIHSGVPIGFFFTPFSIFLIFSRLVALRFMEGMAHEAKIALSMGMMAAAYGLMLAQPGWQAAAIGGAIFGFGYSLSYPTLSVWLSQAFPAGDEANRVKAVALFNAVFCIGLNASPLVAGFVIAQAGIAAVVALLAGLSAISGLGFLAAARRARRARPPERAQG